MNREYSPEKHCGARRRSTGMGARDQGHAGDPCRLPKGYGTDHRGTGHCKYHMGATPAGEATAAKERAAKALEGLGLPIEKDPQQALLEEVYQAVGRKAAIANQYVAAVGADRLAEAVELLKLWNDERDRVAKIAKLAIDAGLAERQVRLAEQQAEALVRVVNAVLEGLNLPADVQEHGRQIAGRELRLLVPAVAAAGSPAEAN